MCCLASPRAPWELQIVLVGPFPLAKLFYKRIFWEGDPQLIMPIVKAFLRGFGPGPIRKLSLALFGSWVLGIWCSCLPCVKPIPFGLPTQSLLILTQRLLSVKGHLPIGTTYKMWQKRWLMTRTLAMREVGINLDFSNKMFIKCFPNVLYHELFGKMITTIKG